MFEKFSDLVIENGRHPLVERNLEQSGSMFTGNDTSLTESTNRTWLITG